MQPGTVFEVRTSFKGIVLFLAAFDAMAVCSILLLVSRPLAGAGLIAFGLLIEAALLLQAIRPRWQYAVGPEGIEVRRTLSFSRSKRVTEPRRVLATIRGLIAAVYKKIYSFVQLMRFYR